MMQSGTHNTREMTDQIQSQEFRSRRITREYHQTIQADPDIIFPLLCPVKEAEWLDGWDYELIYSETGFAESGCVFSTINDQGEETVWVISEYDPQNRRIGFTRFMHESRVCVLSISVHPLQQNIARVHVAYTHTSITSDGNQFIDQFTEDSFLEAVKFWEESMNHYLQTGNRLSKNKR